MEAVHQSIQAESHVKKPTKTSLIRPSYRKHLDGTWSWMCFVFAPRDRTKDDSLPPSCYIHESSAFALISVGGQNHPTQNAARTDMKVALKLCGLDKAPTT